MCRKRKKKGLLRRYYFPVGGELAKKMTTVTENKGSWVYKGKVLEAV